MRTYHSLRRTSYGVTLATVFLAGCPCPPTNTNDNANDNTDNGNDNTTVCRSEPQTTANPAASAVVLGGNARHALLSQIETVPADVGVTDVRSSAALETESLRGTPIPVPTVAYSLVGNGDSVAWVDELYDIYAIDVADAAATLYLDGAPMSITRIADVSAEWIVFYLEGIDAIQVIDRRDGVHRALAGVPAGSEWWPQRIWRDELIRFQPVGGQATDAPGVVNGEIAAVSLLSGDARIVAQTETISLLPQSIPLADEWLYWKQVGPDGVTHQIMRVSLISGAIDTLLEQAQNSQDATVADVLVLIDATADHLFVQRLRSFQETCPGTGGVGARREFGFFEYRDLIGSVTHLLDYDFKECPPGTVTGIVPFSPRLFGERLIWRDPVAGDYAVMDPLTGQVCRVDPFAD